METVETTFSCGIGLDAASVFRYRCDVAAKRSDVVVLPPAVSPFLTINSIRAKKRDFPMLGKGRLGPNIVPAARENAAKIEKIRANERF